MYRHKLFHFEKMGTTKHHGNTHHKIHHTKMGHGLHKAMIHHKTHHITHHIPKHNLNHSFMKMSLYEPHNSNKKIKPLKFKL
jgi:hypothetical protein